MKTGIPIKLDKKDKFIMGQLEEDSRQSYSQIGRKAKLSSETVEYRIDRLQRAGIIIRMFAEPNLSKLGLKTFRIYIKTENMTDQEEEKLVSFFQDHPKAQWFAEFEGEWDFTLRLTLKDENEFKEEMERMMGRFGKFIKAKSIVITLQQAFLPLEHFTGKQGKVHQIPHKKEEKVEDLDEYDQQIMQLLFENARMKTVDIASRLNLSPDTVQYRIKKLRKKGIIRFFGTYFNSHALGYERYKVLLWLRHSAGARERQLIRYCERHPNSTYINRVVAEWDLEVDFDAKNIQELHMIVKTIRNKFPEVVRGHSALAILREHLPNPFRQLTANG
ncbi:MAG: Lrp/AsnC family transcriptional regulator [Candidatus Micrarchaeota archaeon]